MVRLPLALLAITSADVFEVSLPIGGEAELRCSVDDASDAPLQACAASAVAGLGDGAAVFPDCGGDAACASRSLLREGLETLIARAAGRDLGAVACGRDACAASAAAAVLAAADAVGGFACGGAALPLVATGDVAPLLAALAEGGAVARAGCDGVERGSRGVVLVDGRGLDCSAVVAAEAGLRALAPGGTLVIRGAAPCADGTYGDAWRAALALKARAWLDVAVGALDGGVALVRRRRARHFVEDYGVAPGACAFGDFLARRHLLWGRPHVPGANGPEPLDGNGLLAWASDVRGDAPARDAACDAREAAALGARFAASRTLVQGPGDGWNYASALGCPDQDWLPPLLRAEAAGTRDFARRPGTPFLAVNVGANKGFGVAKLLKELAPSLGVTPATWGAFVRAAGAKVACGWCRDCLEDDGDVDARVGRFPTCASPGGFAARELPLRIVVHAVEPLAANVELLRGALRGLGFAAHGDAWTKASREAEATVVRHGVRHSQLISRSCSTRLG